jgi:choline dehydrogenase
VLKEVILAGGAIDTSKLLLLSGLGPEKELEELDIPVVQNLPGVGKNARDHLQVIIVNLMKSSFSGQFQFALDEARKAAASEEWTKSQTGPYTHFVGSAGRI